MSGSIVAPQQSFSYVRPPDQLSGKEAAGSDIFPESTRDERVCSGVPPSVTSYADVSQGVEQAHRVAARAFAEAFPSGAPGVDREPNALSNLTDALAAVAEGAQVMDVKERVLLLDVPSKRYSDIWKEMVAAIKDRQENDSAVFAKVLEQYTGFYKEVTNVLSELGSHVDADGADKVKVNFKSLYEDLTKIVEKYRMANDCELTSESMEKASAEAFCARLGLPETCIDARTRTNGALSYTVYVVTVDTSYLTKIISTLPSKTSNAYSQSLASYNAWKAGFDSQLSRIEEAVQATGLRYSNEFGRIESFNKTISLMIDAMADTARAIVKNW